jgi:hypothetical protein
MTTADQIDAIRALLEETKIAHGVFETTELDGVYDAAWPMWYATYAMDHGIGDLIGHPVSTSSLAELLETAFKDFEESDPARAESWAVYLARRIATEL